MGAVVYLKDQFLPASEASIAIYDAGIVLGVTIAEMTRTFKHQPFRLDDHLKRLYRSCRCAGITPPLDSGRMREVSLEVVGQNASLLAEDQDLSLVHFITAGEIPSYAGLGPSNTPANPTLCIHTFPLDFRRFTSLFSEGAHLVTPSIRHLPAQCVDPKIKHRSRMYQWLGDQQTHQVDPRAISLFLDFDGNVTETGGANFAMVQDSVLIAPTFRNSLPGVSLSTVQELCGELGIGFEQRDFQVHDVVNADEALLLTTPYCLAPVTRINGSRIGTGEVQGPIFTRLIEAWSHRVNLDIVGQIVGGGAKELQADD